MKTKIKCHATVYMLVHRENLSILAVFVFQITLRAVKIEPKIIINENKFVINFYFLTIVTNKTPIY